MTTPLERKVQVLDKDGANLLVVDAAGKIGISDLPSIAGSVKVEDATVAAQKLAVDAAGKIGALVTEAAAAGVKVDIKTDTLGGLKVVEKNATGLLVDLKTDTLGGLKVVQSVNANLKGDVTSNAQNIATETTLGTVHGHVDSIDGKITTCNTGAIVGTVSETNAAGVKVDIKTDTLGGLKVVEKNATGVLVDLKTDTLAGLKVVEKNASGVKVDLVTDTLAGLKVINATFANLKVQNNWEAQTYKTAFASLAVDGNIVAGVANKVIKIHAIFGQAAAAVEGDFKDASGGNVIGHFKFNDREGFVLPPAAYPMRWFQTAVSGAFYCDYSTAAQAYWMVIYTDADAS